MKALVYHGPGRKSWEDVPDATITEPADVVVRVDTTTICGTDLHILQGDVAAVTDGRILGHEAVGTVTEVGEAVSGFSVGDRVLVPAITKCGRCVYCQRGMPSHCQTVGGIGWIFGHLIDGTQAEYVRVPFADTSLYAVPDSVTNEQAIFLADSLPTGYEVGVLAGGVRPGDTVAVGGAGAQGRWVFRPSSPPGCGEPRRSSRSTRTSSGWRRRWSSGPPTPSRSARARSRTSSRSPTVSASMSRSKPSATRRRC